MKPSKKNQLITLSNSVVWAKYGVQEKSTQRALDLIFIALQPTIQNMMKGVRQTDLFMHKNQFQISLSLREICGPSHDYDLAKRAALEIGGLQIRYAEIKKIIEDKKKRKKYYWNDITANFCESVVFPKVTTISEAGDRIEVERDVLFVFSESQLERLVKMERNEIGKPVDYTRYIPVSLKRTRCKYAPKINSLISSFPNVNKMTRTFDDWKELIGVKGFRQATQEELQDAKIIKVNGDKIEYDYCKQFSRFRDKVLLPSKKDLDSLGGNTFDFLIPDSGKKDNKVETITIVFKRKLEYSADDQKTMAMLKNDLGFGQQDIDEMNYLAQFDQSEVQEKIISLTAKILLDTTIAHPVAYCKKAIITMFPPTFFSMIE